MSNIPKIVWDALDLYDYEERSSLLISTYEQIVEFLDEDKILYKQYFENVLMLLSFFREHTDSYRVILTPTEGDCFSSEVLSRSVRESLKAQQEGYQVHIFRIKAKSVAIILAVKDAKINSLLNSE